jgi:TPR repeat protein
MYLTNDKKEAFTLKIKLALFTLGLIVCMNLLSHRGYGMENTVDFLREEAKKGNIIAMLTLADQYREQAPQNLKNLEESIKLYKKVVNFLDQELAKLREKPLKRATSSSWETL